MGSIKAEGLAALRYRTRPGTHKDSLAPLGVSMKGCEGSCDHRDRNRHFRKEGLGWPGEEQLRAVPRAGEWQQEVCAIREPRAVLVLLTCRCCSHHLEPSLQMHLPGPVIYRSRSSCI